MPPRDAVKILPSLLSCDFSRLADEVAAVEAAGADLLHLDVMDGHFVPNLTMGPMIVQAIKRHARIPLDVHLMIESPDRYVSDYARAGADYLTVHVEACPHLHRTLQLIAQQGARPGVALNPHTPAMMVEGVLSECRMVLCMSVNPGFGGQSFIPGVLPKIETFSRWIGERNLDCVIEVDGGVTTETIGAVARAGARFLVAGSAVFGFPPYAQAISALRDRADASLGGPDGSVVP